MTFKKYLSEGWRAEDAIKRHATKLTSDEVKKALAAINAHPAAEENSRWFSGADGDEIDLSDFFKRPKSIIAGGHTMRRVCLVPLNDLSRAQSSVQKNHLLRIIEKNREQKDDSLPEVVYSVDLTHGGNGGDLCILDGHHQLVIYKMAGRRYAKVNLVVATKVGNEKYKYKAPQIDADGRFVRPKSQSEKEADAAEKH